MNDAAIYIVGSALTVAFASFISYSGGEDKWQKFALGAILIAMLSGGAMNILGADAEIFPPDYNENIQSSHMENIAKESFEDGVARLVASELEVPADEIKVFAVNFNFENMSSEKITVYLYGKAALGDYRRVKEILRESGFGECEVVISFEKNGS